MNKLQRSYFIAFWSLFGLTAVGAVYSLLVQNTLAGPILCLASGASLLIVTIWPALCEILIHE